MKKNNKKKIPYLTALVARLAPKIGAKVVVEPKWGITAQIKYKNGVVRSLRMYTLDLNPIASSDIARDKDYAKYFMKESGYPVAEGGTVYSDAWADAIGSGKKLPYGIKYAKKLGYPVIVKPNSKSMGVGVCVAHSEKELTSALKEIWKGDKIAIIERYMPGRDYRIVVLDGEIISAYERTQLKVVGDGKNTILKLLEIKQKNFIKENRDTKINFKDRRIKLKLRKQGYNLLSVIKKGEKVYLLDNANLSTGGDASDVTHTISNSFKKVATNLTRDMGLRIAGVDIMVTKGDITKDAKNCSYYIIEINAAPGLDHYVTTGAKQKRAVEAMYLKVLKALGKKN